MSKFKRFIAFIIDLYIVTFISMLIWGIITIIAFGTNNLDYYVWYFFNMYILTGYILALFKDLAFKNASIGKKILKLAVLTDNNNIPSIWVLIFRNILLPLWPLDVIVIFICNKKIEDFIFKTKVV